MVNLRREKLRNLLQQEMEEYQYEIYSNNGSQYLLDKFTVFNNYNNKNKLKIEDNINYNGGGYNNNILGNNNNQFISLNNINNQNEDENYMKNNNMNVGEPNMLNNNNINNYNYNDYHNDQINNNNGNYNYGNVDLDLQINNYNAYYNKLKVDEFMSKKMIQDDLLNKINQKLMKINKDINDKEYQENLAAKWKQNNSNFQ